MHRIHTLFLMDTVMLVSITCSCGAKLKAPDEAAGKMVACPKCKARLKVPLSVNVPVEGMPQGPVPELAKAPTPTGQEAKRRPFPLWLVLTLVGVPICIGAVVLVALVAVTALGTSSKHQAEEQPTVSVDPEIEGVEFGNWRTVHGHDKMGNEGTWLITTVKAVGSDVARSFDFDVTLYNREANKVTGGFISFPDLQPGETGEVQVRIDNAFRAMISKREPSGRERATRSPEKRHDPALAGTNVSWKENSKSGRVGDVSIECLEARVDSFPAKHLGQWTIDGPMLTVELKLTNTSPTKIVSFAGWQQATSVIEDEHGNRYGLIDFGSDFDGFGDGPWNHWQLNHAVEAESIIAHELSLHPGKTYITYLFAKKPADISKEIRLMLPSKALGGTGTVSLRVPILNPTIQQVAKPGDKAANDAKEKLSEPPKEFTIVQAKFGTGNDWADVTEQVRKLVKDSKLHLVVPRQGRALPQIGFPDPAPNRLKQLVVVYSLNGKEQSVTVETGQELNLPPMQAGQRGIRVGGRSRRKTLKPGRDWASSSRRQSIRRRRKIRRRR
jgi:hypothetical protein